MTSIFAEHRTQWGAIYSQKVSGGQKIKEGAWLVPEIGFKRYRFLTIAGGTELGIRTLPDSSKKKVGVTPPHLAATAQVRARIDLARVVERHASACLRTMGVVSLCGVVVTRRRRYVGARIVPSPRITMETVV